MTLARSDSAAARAARRDYDLEQAARHHREQVGAVAAALKQRTRAARMTGLESVTLHLTIGDAALIAAALTEWASRAAHDETRAAIHGRRDQKDTP